jgi:hypothetical protein
MPARRASAAVPARNRTVPVTITPAVPVTIQLAVNHYDFLVWHLEHGAGLWRFYGGEVSELLADHVADLVEDLADSYRAPTGQLAVQRGRTDRRAGRGRRR